MGWSGFRAARPPAATARSGGTVRAVHVELKQSVEAQAVLVELEIEEKD